MKKIAYPGTFDPFHYGHQYIIESLAKIFDEVHVFVFDNISKNVLKSNDQRSNAIANVFNSNNIIVHKSKQSLDYELQKHKIGFVGRGIRNDQDLNIELQRATMLKQISNVETIFIPTSKDYVFISSSIIRELIFLNKDISSFVPCPIVNLYKKKL